MDTSPIELFDRVRLKSGGPEMQVWSTLGEKVACTWMDERGGHHTDEFYKACLVHASQEHA